VAKPKARDWRRLLRGLMDTQLRDDLGRSHRAIVADHLTIDRHAYRWAEAWRTAYRAIHQGGRREQQRHA